MGLVRSNQSAVGASLFCTHACCELCAIDIVDAGIVEFYYLYEYRCNKGLQYLVNNGIIVRKIILEN